MREKLKSNLSRDESILAKARLTKINNKLRSIDPNEPSVVSSIGEGIKSSFEDGREAVSKLRSNFPSRENNPDSQEKMLANAKAKLKKRLENSRAREEVIVSVKDTDTQPEKKSKFDGRSLAQLKAEQQKNSIKLRLGSDEEKRIANIKAAKLQSAIRKKETPKATVIVDTGDKRNARNAIASARMTMDVPPTGEPVIKHIKTRPSYPLGVGTVNASIPQEQSVVKREKPVSLEKKQAEILKKYGLDKKQIKVLKDFGVSSSPGNLKARISPSLNMDRSLKAKNKEGDTLTNQNLSLWGKEVESVSKNSDGSLAVVLKNNNTGTKETITFSKES